MNDITWNKAQNVFERIIQCYRREIPARTSKMEKENVFVPPGIDAYIEYIQEVIKWPDKNKAYAFDTFLYYTLVFMSMANMCKDSKAVSDEQSRQLEKLAANHGYALTRFIEESLEVFDGFVKDKEEQ